MTKVGSRHRPTSQPQPPRSRNHPTSRSPQGNSRHQDQQQTGKFVRDNGLSLVLVGLFVLFLVGQTFSGWLHYNEGQQQHRQPQVGLFEYIRTGSYGEAVFENWESEFLQMGLYVLLTTFLFQRGSAESKDPDKSDEPETGGFDAEDAPRG
jgi:hypothetical protein